MSQFRQLRILFLLLVLLAVALSSWLTKLRTTDWDRPLVVAVYPINADGSERARDYIATLEVSVFRDIESFFAREAARYGLGLKQPVEVVLAPELAERPPLPPRDRNVLGVMWWSLKMRFWAWRVARESGVPANIQMFVLYHDPQTSPRVAHSLGLQKGLLGVVHAFASYRQEAGNNLVIAHEILHTVGASDKYNPADNRPLYPIGYAEPEREPLLPQARAEIMAGRRPVSEAKAVEVDGLDEALIGRATALEIRWID